MASARARLGKARRNIIKRQKTTNVVTGALGALGTVASFGIGQAKKADTAWGEYEAGYKELGGTDFKRPEFGDKGYFKSRFKGPEGEVSIGAGKERRTYDIGKVQKAGAFLGSDAAAILNPEQRKQYLGRTAPGRADPLTGKLQSPLTQMTGDTGVGFGKGLGMGFKGDLPKRYTEGEFLKTGETERSGMVFNEQGDLVREMLPQYSMDAMSGAGKIGIQSPDFLAGKDMGISDFEQSQMEFKNQQAQYKRSDEWSGKKRREASLHERIRRERGTATLADWKLEDIKAERDTEQASILEESKTRLSQPLDAPTYPPEFLQKQQDYLQSPAYARYQEDLSVKGINKTKEDELARQFYNQNPKRSAYDTWDQSRNKSPFILNPPEIY